MASTLADPARFFARLRRLTGPLDQGQVGIVNALLAAGALWPPGWLAYALATAWHEARFTPQAEWGRGGAGLRAAGPLWPGAIWPGPRPADVGPQLRMGRPHAWPEGRLLRNFDLAPSRIWPSPFWSRAWSRAPSPGSPLADCITGTGTHAQFVKARRIINGTDRAGISPPMPTQSRRRWARGWA
jgi:hypothetical protein